MFAERCVLSQIGYLSFHQSSPTLDRSPNSAVHTVFTRVSGRSTVCSPVDNSMDKSTNGVKSQSVSKSQNNISRLGQPWDNGGTNLLFTGMNDDSKQKAQVLDSLGLFLWCPGRGERIRTSGLYVPNVALYQAKLHPALQFAPKAGCQARLNGVAQAIAQLILAILM